MVAVRQKPPELLAFRRGGRGKGLQAPFDRPARVPRCPVAKPRPAVADAWRALWRSEVSRAIDVHADTEALRHWVECMQQRAELLEQIEREGFTGPWGPMDSLVAHPSLVYVKHLDKEITRIREHFGMTPMSRFRLQMQFAEAGKSTADLDRILERRNRAAQAVDATPERAPDGALVVQL